MFYGFEPVFDKNSRVLILGSFPSVKSRAAEFYYGNKQNRFWRLLESIFECSIGQTTADKKAFLLQNRIALWDAVQACEIKGSSDAHLKCVQAADIPRVVSAADIQSILCNGKTAYKVFAAAHPSLTGIAQCLPSTSPANPRFDPLPWAAALKILL